MTKINELKAVIQQGDKVTLVHCGGSKVTIKFAQWSGDWLRSKTNKEYHASNVVKINGIVL